ncbi:hypothetical protein GCM10011390_48920 [Aureimonas endophytica]|uniref:Flagellar protein FliL n=1 Tax=Aureimonas endophytica TaxID=2027858 RepID=A0A917ED28_9HYPH|nr:flagellar basal body-associated FliL family protein [Aureimonas endophytica]GGE23719.1 hypothetical protein GCM10011390_48920 [Aureimonas endophytica]
MTDTSADALIAQATGALPDQSKKKGGMVATIGVIVGLTLVAVGGGAAVGWTVGGQALRKAEALAKPKEEPAAEKEAPPPPPGPDAIVKLQPILTNVATPSSMVIRLQASIVYRKADVPDPAVLAAEVEGDTLAFLRTVDIVQIEGTRGLLHLKEDLTERAKLRSPAIKDYLIESLVAQ